MKMSQAQVPVAASEVQTTAAGLQTAVELRLGPELEAVSELEAEPELGMMSDPEPTAHPSAVGMLLGHMATGLRHGGREGQRGEAV